MTEKLIIIDAREHRAEWHDVRTAPPHKQHLYASADGQGIRCEIESWEAFICRDMFGKYHVRIGSGKSHLNLVQQFTGVETLDEAKAKAEADIRKRAAAAFKRRVAREAKKAMAAACLLLAFAAPQAEADGCDPSLAWCAKAIADSQARDERATAEPPAPGEAGFNDRNAAYNARVHNKKLLDALAEELNEVCENQPETNDSIRCYRVVRDLNGCFRRRDSEWSVCEAAARERIAEFEQASVDFIAAINAIADRRATLRERCLSDGTLPRSECEALADSSSWACEQGGIENRRGCIVRAEQGYDRRVLEAKSRAEIKAKAAAKAKAARDADLARNQGSGLWTNHDHTDKFDGATKHRQVIGDIEIVSGRHYNRVLPKLVVARRGNGKAWAYIDLGRGGHICGDRIVADAIITGGGVEKRDTITFDISATNDVLHITHDAAWIEIFDRNEFLNIRVRDSICGGEIRLEFIIVGQHGVSK